MFSFSFFPVLGTPPSPFWHIHSLKTNSVQLQVFLQVLITKPSIHEFSPSPVIASFFLEYPLIASVFRGPFFGKHVKLPLVLCNIPNFDSSPFFPLSIFSLLSLSCDSLEAETSHLYGVCRSLRFRRRFT